MAATIMSGPSPTTARPSTRRRRTAGTRAIIGEFSGRAGIAYEFANGVTPYASVSTFFNPVIGTNSAGDLFVPETGVQYEVGVKIMPTLVDGIFTVSLFDLTRENVRVRRPG